MVFFTDGAPEALRGGSVKIAPNDYEPSALPWINQTEKMRIAPVINRFEGRFFYGLNNEFWQPAADVNGARVYLPEKNGVSLSIAGASGDAYYDITKTIFFYQPDTVVHAATALSFEPEAGVVRFWGLVSYQGGVIKDGYILRQNETAIEFVKISSTSGSPVETVIPQSQWNDPMDGTGKSGIVLDFSALQMVKIEHAWYGGGTAKLLFRVGGKTYTAAQFNGANNGTKDPIIANPTLSIMYGIHATANVGTAKTFEHYGLSVGSDGDKEPTGKPFAVASGPKSVPGGDWVPIVSVRLKTQFSIDGAALKPNVYGYINELIVATTVLSKDADIAFIKDAGLTGATFTSIPDILGNPISDSMVEYDISATAVTAGNIIYADTLPAPGRSQITIATQDVIAVDSLGLASTTLTLVARAAAGGTATVRTAFSWREVY